MACPAGADGAAGRLGDIIDLDRYMRAAVRRSASDTTDEGRNERLVVDCGGVKSGAAALSSSSAECAVRAHHKRFSHDSGLSDGSYAPRMRRPHRRSSTAEGGPGRAWREGREGRAAGSSDSLREFRAACERALLDQQQQLARVTQLCERLAAPPHAPRPTPQHTPLPAPTHAPVSSDLSSSSCSTKDQRRKDKHRANECKTYKIIMNKLDELNRLFAARARSPAGPGPLAASAGPPAAPRRRAPLSSVAVSDKRIATEPLEKHNNSKPHTQRAPPRRVVRAVTRAYALDIAPAAAARRDRPNVATESIVERGSVCEESASSACDARCGFDLDDPVHLYAQAKRLQALHASTRRSKSAGYEASRSSRMDKRLGERLDRRPCARESSLCALCRGYWRAMRRYLGAQLTGPNA